LGICWWIAGVFAVYREAIHDGEKTGLGIQMKQKLKVIQKLGE